MSPSNTIFSPSSCSVDVASRFQNSTGSDGGRYMQPNKVLSLPVPALSHINSRLEGEWSKMCLALTCSFTKMQIPPPLRHGVQEDRQVHPSAHGLSRRKRIVPGTETSVSEMLESSHVSVTASRSRQCSSISLVITWVLCRRLQMFMWPTFSRLYGCMYVCMYVCILYLNSQIQTSTNAQ